MGHSAANHGQIKNPGTYQVSSPIKAACMVFAAIGVAVFAFGLTSQPTRTWAAFVQNHFYFMSLAIGGLFWAAIQWLTGAMWSAPVRRVSESFTAYLPVALLSFAVLYFGIHHLYSWSHLEHVKGDPVLEGKSGYLSVGFFMARNLLAIGVWIWFAKKLIGNSLKQDATKDVGLTLSNRSWTPVFLIFFALSFTMGSFDQLMSLDPHWFSTMYGVYCFAGMFYSTLAASCLLIIFLKKQGHLEGLVNDNHLHDMGKFMFAFTVFWAYIGFSQFLLIWYANLPEETGYYIRRMEGRWVYVSIFLLVGKFMTPFFLLLPRDAKRNMKVLTRVGVFMLVAQWIDMMWLVQPEFFSKGPVFGLIEVGVTLGFLGVFGLMVARFLGKNNVVAIGDPRLEESVFHHHQ